ncbi:MAG: hypothetical protein AAGC55_14600, partial [Myxococcota bacterium]
RCSRSGPGAFRLLHSDASGAPRVIIAGSDGEGARNGLYHLLRRAGFGFFRDGDRLPDLREQAVLATLAQSEPVARRGHDVEHAPAFRWRGEMCWDHYLGPQRYCAATWGPAEWNRTLLYLARTGQNFVEFYPPLAAIYARAFPAAAAAFGDGVLWRAAAKHALARQILARGRDLGIRFMYVLSYGHFPAPVRAHYPDLEWAGSYLCAHQPELMAMARDTWAALIDELGTDHLYVIRHRGEEGQSYSDPCRSVSKAEGLAQAHRTLRAVDGEAIIHVWTWGETLPDLFESVPADMRAVHIRHGVGRVFSARGHGREQSDGRPHLPAGRRWLVGQFTTFGGHDTLLRTSWSDAHALARDARAAAGDPLCDGYFHWPEWSATSPWLSHVLAELAWQPAHFDPERALIAYARSRHGARAEAFLAGLRPLLAAGNARLLTTPRKRLMVPYYLYRPELARLGAIRAGLGEMARALLAPERLAPAADGLRRSDEDRGAALLARDVVDVLTWVARRQAEVFEAAAYLSAAADRSPAEYIVAARRCWATLAQVLGEIPELSLVATARAAAAQAPLSARAIDSFWTLGCDFYKGYPLTLSVEAIELVYDEQCRRLGQVLQQALGQPGTPRAAPGWFWHDFADPTWAESVRQLPREDGESFERAVRQRIAHALTAGRTSSRHAAPDSRPAERWPAKRWSRDAWPAPTRPTSPRRATLKRAVASLLSQSLPAPLDEPPA